MGQDTPHGSPAPTKPTTPPLDGDGNGLPDGEWVEAQRKNANAMGAGLQFGVVICLFAFVGLKADDHFGTGPWLLVAGVLVGFIGGTLSLLKKFK